MLILKAGLKKKQLQQFKVFSNKIEWPTSDCNAIKWWKKYSDLNSVRVVMKKKQVNVKVLIIAYFRMLCYCIESSLWWKMEDDILGSTSQSNMIFMQYIWFLLHTEVIECTRKSKTILSCQIKDWPLCLIQQVSLYWAQQVFTPTLL